MNKREAEAIARDIERHGCELRGLRIEFSQWYVEAFDKATGAAFSIYDAAQWQERKFDGGLEPVAATPGRPPLSPDGVRMVYHSIAMPDALWAWAERDGNRSANVRKAVDAVRLLTPEQWAWLNAYGTPAEVLAEAVQFRMDVERAEAEAEDLSPTYNGGRW